VTDRSGTAVTNLERDDFVVTDDGVVQPITLFARDSDTPLSVAIALDVSGSMKEELAAVNEGLREYLAVLKPDDETALVTFGRHVTYAAALGRLHDRVASHLDRVTAGGGTALYEGIVAGAGALRDSRHDKKVLLLVTDGNNTVHSTRKQDAIRAVQESEAMVYALGIGHSGRDSLRGRVVAALNGPQIGLLRSIAEISGGRADLVDDVNGSGRARIRDAIVAFGDELRQQYTLGYYPSAHRPDRSSHQLQVTTRNPAYTVRARKVYVTR